MEDGVGEKCIRLIIVEIRYLLDDAIGKFNGMLRDWNKSTGLAHQRMHGH